MSLEANSPTVRRIHAESDSRRSAAEVAIALSPGILGIKHIASMLGLKKVLSPREARKLAVPADVVLAWGRKETAEAAVEYASRCVLPVWFLEDGWIRTSSERAHSRRSYSILVDEVGVMRPLHPR